jgi:hypothetical protein
MDRSLTFASARWRRMGILLSARVESGAHNCRSLRADFLDRLAFVRPEGLLRVEQHGETDA